MAKQRTRSRSQPKGGAKPNPTLGQFMRGEVVGSVLLVVAVLILLSMLSANRGTLLGAVIDWLRWVFGIGIYLIPFLLGALGVWLALRDVTEQRLLTAGRLIGALVLFLVVEAAAHMFAGMPDPWSEATAGLGGGLIGWVLGYGLATALGQAGAAVIVVIAAAAALIALSGLSLAEVRQKLVDAWRAPERPRAGSAGDATRGGTPMLPGILEGTRASLWQRLRERLLGKRPVEAEPPPPPPVRPAPAAATEPRKPAAAPPAGGGQPAAVRSGPVQPRIIGGPGQHYRLPALEAMLEDSTEQDIQEEDLRRRVQIIENTLAGFGVPVQVVEVNQGPAVTQFGLRPGTIVRKDRKGEERHVRVRVSQIQALANDLSLALAASPIRIEAPVPGRDFVGVEVPNYQISLVSLRGVMESDAFREAEGSLLFGLGRDVSGQPSVADLARMPHLLIAGATGSGKSVCVNAFITSMLLTHTPDTLRLLMIDPKRVELTVYNGIPHLLAPVVVDVERAVPVLQWATHEMERRYKLFAKAGARNIESYNEKRAAHGETVLPFIVLVIDELADLMLSAPEEVERYICRIAQMARATGMHLVLATQRPSVDVVTGLIKANFPARIAFAVTSQIDSRVILDTPGAEQLLGRGDMLFMAPDSSKLQRLQGCFVSDRETLRLVQYWKGARPLAEPGLSPVTGEEAPPFGAAEDVELEPPWVPGQEALQQPLWDDLSADAMEGGRDDLYKQAVEEVKRSGKASISLLQRRLRIGYSRAARLIDQMEADGIIGAEQSGSRGREVLARDR